MRLRDFGQLYLTSQINVFETIGHLSIIMCHFYLYLYVYLYFSAPSHSRHPLAILFTSFSDRPEKEFIYTNTIKNWASFLPRIQPVLFTTFKNGRIIELAKKHGWYVFPNPAINQFKMPVLKKMYLFAYKTFNASFYGFANGDILFDEGLMRTLLKLDTHLDTIDVSLLYGMRRNYNISRTTNYTLTPIWPQKQVSVLAHPKHSEVFRPEKGDAMDYFFVTQYYPFEYLLPLVISRQGFDTYFVTMSNLLNLTTIDGTGSVMAVHQTDGDGTMAHLSIQREADRDYNIFLMGHDFEFTEGYARDSRYSTQIQRNGEVMLKCLRCQQKRDLF